jgi:carbonic anhydrase
MDEVLEHLKAGMRRFRSEVYPEQAERYQRVMEEPQQPLALLITCADSRIHPDVLLQTSPGEIFVTRNIGNMVPMYPEMVGGVSAVLEYAVTAVKVRHVAVGGHTDCGAMKALLDPASVQGMPLVRSWLTNAGTILEEARAIQRARKERDGVEPDLLHIITELNVLLQMKHVATHPSVAEAKARGELTISGWVYDIAAGDVRIHDADTGRFEPLMLPSKA